MYSHIMPPNTVRKKKTPAFCHFNFHPKTSTDETNIRQASESTNTYLFSEVIAEDTGYKDRDWQSPRDGIVCCFGKRRVDVQIKGQNANSKAEQKSNQITTKSNVKRVDYHLVQLHLFSYRPTLHSY